MEWTEVQIATTSNGVEIVSGMLINLGVSGLIIDDDEDLQRFLNSSNKNWDYVDEELLNRKGTIAYVKFYLSKDPIGFEVLSNIKTELNQIKNIDYGFSLGSLLVTDNLVDDKDWVDKWKQYYKPFSVGEKIIIKPTWENIPENSDGKIIFNIEPGHVFGTGLHQTTKLCIAQLEKYISTESEVLDLGCGTGILSIISILLGAKEAYAIDIEHGAVSVAYKNAELNYIDKSKYKVFSGNILEDEKAKAQIDKKFNVVVANIVADIIIAFREYVKTILTEDGIFITSGIIDSRVGDVEDALVEAGFKIISSVEMEGWFSVVAKLGE